MSEKVEELMTASVITAQPYQSVKHVRNHGIQRVVVTHEQKVPGMLSAFDLLKLVGSHRYVAKYAPTQSKRKGGKRR